MGHNGERSAVTHGSWTGPTRSGKLVKDAEDDDDDIAVRRVYFTAYGRDVDQPETLLVSTTTRGT